ncbi:MAG: hypothetical protein IJR59_02925, partial [Firmicutes bacterium]|nr:hypothetical protein [Bacillota bacterium]
MAKSSRKKDGDSSATKYFSDDMTKEVVGRLFEQYTADDGRNYFSPSARKNSRDEEESIQKEEDRKSFFDESEDYEEFEEEDKHESKLAGFFKKARQIVFQDDDDDEDEDNGGETDTDGELNVSDGEDVQAMPEQPSEESQQTYVPRRKVRQKKPRPNVEEKEQSGEEEVFPENVPVEELKKGNTQPEQPRKLTRREQMEKRVEEKHKRAERTKKPDVSEPYEDENFDEDESEVIEIPVARIALIAIIVVVGLLLIILARNSIHYSTELKKANAQIEELEKQNTSSTYEKEIEELKAKNEELTKQLDDIRAASAVVSETNGSSAAPQTAGSDPTVGAGGEGDTSNLSQTANSSQSYEIKEYTGEPLWDFAESIYGDGSRYKD